jgi:hypothetical protein
MDSLRAFDEDTAYASSDEVEDAIEAPPEIGVDERRMHVRAYNYWVSLLDGRPFPSIKRARSADDRRFRPEQRAARFLRRGRRRQGRLARPRAARGMRPLGRHPPDQRRAQALACCRGSPTIICRSSPTRRRSASRPSSSASAAEHHVPRHIDALLVDRRDDRLHLRRDQLEGSRRQRDRRRIAREARSALASAAPVEASPVWADGPNSEPPEPTSPPRPPRSRPGTSRACRSRPASPTACAPPANAPKPPPARKRAAAPPSTARSATPTISRSPPRRSRPIMPRCWRMPASSRPGARADDRGRQARLRRRLRQGAPHRIRRRAQLGEARGSADRQLRRNARIDRRRPQGASSRPSAARAGPSRRPDGGEAARAALRAARPLGHVAVEAGEDEFVLLVGRRDEVGGVAVVARIADPALLERAIRKAGQG